MITNKQFYDGVEKVIDINALAQKSHNFLDKNAIKKQKKLIIEETTETIEDGILSNNIEEVVDGIVDVFVVASYYEFLLCDNEEDFKNEMKKQVDLFTIDFSKPIDINSVLKKLLNLIVTTDEKGSILSLLFTLLKVVDVVNKKDISYKAISDVAENMFLKFPIYKDENTIKNELKYLEKKYPDRKDFVAVKKGERIVYLDDNGVGKFLKPSTYKEVDLTWTKKEASTLMTEINKLSNNSLKNEYSELLTVIELKKIKIN